MAVEEIIDRISKELKEVPGIVGLVLEGSRARAYYTTSDIDIGIYYDELAGFNLLSKFNRLFLR